MSKMSPRIWTLAAILVAALACRERASQTANEPPAGEGAATAATTPSETSGAPAGADQATVTADPVAASQRNAARRRAARAAAERSEREEEARAEAPRGGRHEVPEGTILRVQFDRPISTATAKVGETIRGELLDDVMAADGTLVAPSGSGVVATIEHVVSSGKLARPAELKFRLTQLEPKGGSPVSISTSAYEERGKTHTARNAGYIAGGAAVGAILGQILGGDTESTLKGTAAGAAAGTGVAALTGDLDFAIEAGRTIAFTLEKPVELPASR